MKHNAPAAYVSLLIATAGGCELVYDFDESDFDDSAAGGAGIAGSVGTNNEANRAGNTQRQANVGGTSVSGSSAGGFSTGSSGAGTSAVGEVQAGTGGMIGAVSGSYVGSAGTTILTSTQPSSPYAGSAGTGGTVGIGEGGTGFGGNANGGTSTASSIPVAVGGTNASGGNGSGGAVGTGGALAGGATGAGGAGAVTAGGAGGVATGGTSMAATAGSGATAGQCFVNANAGSNDGISYAGAAGYPTYKLNRIYDTCSTLVGTKCITTKGTLGTMISKCADVPTSCGTVYCTPDEI